MKHYSTAECIDFVNGTAPQVVRQEMQKHLDSGCKRCQEAVTLWEKVRRTTKTESSFQPPAETVRAVKAAFGLAGVAGKRKFSQVIAELVFDSFQQSALAGVRSSHMHARQMLFRAHPFQIDVQIEAHQGDSRLRITGQLLDISHSGAVVSDIPVTLSNRRGQVVQTATNCFGEFHGDLDNRGDLELSFPGPGDNTVVVSLAGALAHFDGGPRTWLSGRGAE